MSPRPQVFIWVGLFVFVDWWCLALVSIGPGDGPIELILLGHFLGSLYAQATLAGAWSVLGPGPKKLRLPLSCGWVLALLVAIAINISLQPGPSTEALIFIGLGLVGQWLLVQLLLLLLAWGTGVKLRTAVESGADMDAGQFRFGIRHLLFGTVLASLLLGAGRALFPYLEISNGDQAWIFAFLALASVVITIPLLFAGLMRRLAVVGVLLGLLFVGLITILESPLLSHLGGSGPEPKHFWAINACSALVTLLVVLIVRVHGFFLVLQSRRTSTRAI